MTERQKATEFLKTLIRCEESAQGRYLEEKILKAEKEEKCVRCAIFMVGLVVLLSLSGLCYSAVFVPQISHYSSHFATKLFSALGLRSLICLLVFLGCWLWYRAMANRVFADCRRYLWAVFESRIKHSAEVSPLAPFGMGSLRVYETETPKSKDEAGVFVLAKAS